MSATTSISSDVVLGAKRDLAAAFRAAAHYGFNEGIDNHFSLAVPGSDDLFLLNRYGPHWSEITEHDILTIDFDGRVVDGEGEWETSAFLIHRGCHQARPSARAVFHTHMPYATALSMTVGGFDTKLSQNSMLFHDRIARLPYGGLVDAAEEGCRFGEVIGDEITVVMLDNHGVMVIGTDVADAWQKLYFFERASQMQVLAQSTGQPLIRVSDAIAEHTAAQWLKEAPKDCHRVRRSAAGGRRYRQADFTPSLPECPSPLHRPRSRASPLPSRQRLRGVLATQTQRWAAFDEDLRRSARAHRTTGARRRQAAAAVVLSLGLRRCRRATRRPADHRCRRGVGADARLRPVPRRRHGRRCQPPWHADDASRVRRSTRRGQAGRASRDGSARAWRSSSATWPS